MNRRSFLTRSAGAGIGSAALIMGGYQSARGQSSQGPDPNLISSAATAHAIQTSGCYIGSSPYTDWYNLSSVHRSILVDYQNKNLDAEFIPAAQRMSASQFDLSVIDQNAILAAIQAYQPTIMLSDIQQLLTNLPTDPTSVQNALSSLQTQGLAPLISQASNSAYKLGGYIYRATHPSGPSGPSMEPTLINQPAVTPRPQKPFPPEGGGISRYNCSTDGTILLGLGTALAVIAFMSAPEIGILAAGFWGPTATWGGIAMAGWTAGHAIFCGIS